MPISVSDPSDGAAMSWSTLASQFATMRTWLNAVPVTDVEDASIEREHLVRPVVSGFPTQAQESSWRHLRWQDRGRDVPSLWSRTRWSIPERVTICPRETYGGIAANDNVWRTPIGCTMDPGSSEHRIRFSCSYQVRMNPTLWAPAGALGPKTKAGELQVRAYVRSVGLEVTTVATADLYCNEYDSTDPVGLDPGGGAAYGRLYGKVDLFALLVTVPDDLYVVFVRTRDNVDQVDLSRIAFHTEVF